MKDEKTSTSRREFLKIGASGLAGMAVLPSVIREDPNVLNSKTVKRKMVTRTLGRTGMELPIVSMGVMNANNPELVEAALDAGIVYLDTAHGYQRGRNEEMIGDVVKGKPRDSFVIATKIYGPMSRRTGMFTEDATAEFFMERFETSLERLGLDYVDILYIHSVVCKEAVLHEPFLSTMVKLKKEGRIRFLGVSTHSNEPEVIRAAAESGIHDVVLTAYNFRQPHVDEIESAMADAVKSGVGIVAMKTQAGVYWDRERQNQINMKAALKWVLRNEDVHTTIPGFTTFEQLETDLSVMEELTLTPEEKKDLELGCSAGLKGLYCRQCGQCRDRCRYGLEIPAMMRSFMYVYGYGNLTAAKQALREVDLSDLPCRRCPECTVECTMGFDVRERIVDIARIGNVPEDFLV
jgi:aryl-alcohol dehydrogenase-like predicted oxidoreductase